MKCFNRSKAADAEATSTDSSASTSSANAKQALDAACLAPATLARAETRVINCLRAAVLLVLLITTAVVATGVYLYTRNEEEVNFTSHFEESARQVIDSFHDGVERNLGAAAALSTAFTSYAKDTNQSFPFVTLPDFEQRGSHFRSQSGSFVVHYLPLVTDETRAEWEEYANRTRDHIDIAFESDTHERSRQDAQFALDLDDNNNRALQDEEVGERRPLTITEDGSGYHPKIWSNGAVVPLGDEPEGSGPYYPTWQRSPISRTKQAVLNMNWVNAKVIGPGLAQTLQKEKKAALRNAAVPIPKYLKQLEGNLKISQYREMWDDYIDGLSTFLAYPVFNSFDDDKEVAGVIASNFYWKVLFSNLLPMGSNGILCVVENSLNQTFTYQIDGPDATFLQMGDVHDRKFEEHKISLSINEYLEQRANPMNRAYATVPLSDDTTYRITVYPSQATEDAFVTNKPVTYTIIVCFGFVFTAGLFLAFSYAVERRQKIMLEKVVENSRKAALAERELNEFLSHEVRNPLSAAISACSFVSTAINGPEPLKDPETRKYAREDINVVDSSLHFINDFLRSMLDIHRAQIKIEKAPVDILKDVFEPVSSILYKRVASYEVQVDCPQGLIVLTDCIRLKQVVLNLVRNSSKFVEKGFLRMRAGVVNHVVCIYVEDSGPGIPEDKCKNLFVKYQESLDLLNQGTGLGLSLCKKLVEAMGGSISLDNSYQSGIEGFPGACFVIHLNTPPIDIESTLPTEYDDSQRDFVVHARQEKNPDKNLPEAMPTSTINPPASILSTTEEKELPEELSVLFVDDDAVLRRLFVRAVKRAQPHWKVEEASSGEIALSLCSTRTFDLIFMDQYMASVDKQLTGTETVAALRSNGVESIICGLSANDIRDSFVDAGANHFMLKPIPCKPEVLKKALLGVLEIE